MAKGRAIGYGIKMSGHSEVMAALNAAGVHYLVVGGVAVVAHGHARLTLDLDLVVQLETENLTRAMDALSAIGFRPFLPVSARQFADPEIRRDWTQNRQMIVFQLWKPQLPQFRLDIFTTEPFAFGDAWKRRLETTFGGVIVPVVPLAELLSMKQAAGRPKDLEDVRALSTILQARKENS